MNSKPISILMTAALGCSALPVQAVPVFSEIDTDKDGFVSATESIAVPGLSEQMIVLDRNADGKLSAEEYALLTNIPTEQGVPTEQSIPKEQGIPTEEGGAGEPSIY